MKKIVICNVTMRETVEPLSYAFEEGLPTRTSEPVVYPILGYLGRTLRAGEKLKIVLLCKCDPQQRYLKNVAIFQEEFRRLCSGCEAEYQLLHTEFDEEEQASQQVLLDLVDAVDEGAEILADITYGSKTLPILVLEAMGFAVKHLGCVVKHVFYGQVFFQGAVPTEPKLRDLAYLLYLNSLLSTMECRSPEEARRTLGLLLKL